MHLVMPASREFDVVVFGASGFTGKYVVYELADKAPNSVTIAIAGRSQSKVINHSVISQIKEYYHPVMNARDTIDKL